MAIPKQIKVLITPPCGDRSTNLTPGSIHSVVEPPKEEAIKHPNGARGYWVDGTTEPILMLFGEFTEI
jgi:hypothetical protein